MGWGVRETGTPGFMLTLRVLAVSVPLANVLLVYVCVCGCARAGGRGTGGVRDEIGASLVKVCEVKRAQRDDNRTP